MSSLTMFTKSAYRISAAVAVVLSLLFVVGQQSTADAPKETEPPAPHGPLPTRQHLAWHNRQFYAFVHFNMNTFTGIEWGHGSESPDRFQPSQLDCRQWCALFKECGLTGVILTAKHHDGFCLWPSRFTEHDVASSSWRDGQGDVVRELADACREYNLWLGIYVSPWDRNNPLYGKDDAAYNNYFAGQLEELLTNYGPIAEVWWDGANGDRNDPQKHQKYDWPHFIRTVRRFQPEAVIFAPPYTPGDIRWMGNEQGFAGETQWSTYPAGIDEDPITLNVGVEGADTWMPAETDVSIRPGWYWTRDTDNRVKSVDELLDIYCASVGHNTNLLLNFPVDDRGLVPEGDARRLREVTTILRATFANDLAAGRPVIASDVRGENARFAANTLTDGKPSTYWTTDDSVTTASVEITLAKPEAINHVVLQEHIELGQRIRAWTLEARVDGEWRQVFEGTTIGHKRIARFPTVTAEAVRLSIDDSRACPVLESLSVCTAPPNVTIHADKAVFLDQTTVELAADMPNCEIFYTLDETTPGPGSLRYTEPLKISKSCVICAAVSRNGQLSPRRVSMKLVGYNHDSLRQPLEVVAPLEPGLRVSKYDGGWQTLDQMVDRVPVESGRCAGFDLNQRLRDEHAALAFEGLLHVPTDGIYEFFLGSDDGSRLYIGDSKVIDNDGIHSQVELTGHVGLQAGFHQLRVEWFNAVAGSGLTVLWAGPGFEKQAIPSKALRLPLAKSRSARQRSAPPAGPTDAFDVEKGRQ